MEEYRDCLRYLHGIIGDISCGCDRNPPYDRQCEVCQALELIEETVEIVK